ncbi:GTP-binding protein GTR2 [Rhodotorula toruloides]|nr:GTP-binding protein GTR2 [Rhodotorula toruloides]
MPRLEVRVGSDRFHTEVAWVNHTSRPTEIDTPLFTGRVLVLVRNFDGVTPDGSPPKRDAKYFEGRSRKFAILIEGRFKRREGVPLYTGDEVQFGSDFDYLPASFPMGPFNLGMKISHAIDPATYYEFKPPHGRPYIMSPYTACMNTFCAYPSPSALSRAVVLSHHSSTDPHEDGQVERGTFVPTEEVNQKRKWVERPHWSFLGLKGHPRVDAFLASHSHLLPPSGTATPSSNGNASHLAPPSRPNLNHQPSSLALGTRPKSAADQGSETGTPVRSDSPSPTEVANGAEAIWGAPVFAQPDSHRGSGSSTPSADIPSSAPKKKKSGSKFSLSSLMGALDVSGSGSSTPKNENDHLLMADQLASPVEGRKRAQSVGVQYKPKAEVQEALGAWRFADEEIDVTEDTNFVFLDPDHPRSIAQRRKHFCVDNGKHRKEFVYDPDIIYTASFFVPYFDFNTFDLKLGPIGMNVGSYFKDMPVRYTLRSTRMAPRPDGKEGPMEEEVFATVSFRVSQVVERCLAAAIHARRPTKRYEHSKALPGGAPPRVTLLCFFSLAHLARLLAERLLPPFFNFGYDATPCFARPKPFPPSTNSHHSTLDPLSSSIMQPQPTYGTAQMVSPAQGSPVAGASTQQDATVDGKGRRLPRVLLMGPRSGGKSSIRKVVFEGMAPNDTLFIEKTNKSSSDDIKRVLRSFLSMRMWDLPGSQLDPEQLNLSFEDTDAVIFVLDAQSTLHDVIRKLSVTMHKAYTANPGIQFEIFLHKVDGMSEDYRLDTLQNLRDRLTEELFDMSPELESNMNVFYHLTSVFDTSIYEALSKVIQKLIPEQAMLERLLDLLCQQCSMDKAFIFETASKIYIATDSAPLDNQTYVICADYLDLVGDFAQLYETPALSLPPAQGDTSLSRAGTLSRSTGRDASSSSTPSATGSRRESSTAASKPSSTISSPAKAGAGRPISVASSVGGGLEGKRVTRRLPHSKVRLGTGATIAQWSINDHLSLVALLRPHTQDQHSAMIDYNVATFRQAVLAIFGVGVSAPIG